MIKMVCLNGRNYNIWKIYMKDLLFVKKMHVLVFSAHKPENVTDENWEFGRQQVYWYIRQCVEDNVRNHIVNETHARTLWEKLETLYASKNGNKKLFLFKQLMDFKYKEGSPILDHINDFRVFLINYQEWVLILMMNYKDFGFLIFYRILGKPFVFL